MKIHAALLKQQKGQDEEALRRYEELYARGVCRASYMLPYSVLLLRRGEEADYSKVKELLAKAEKARDLTRERRQQLLMNYAVAAWKSGDLRKAVSLLEASHREQPCGLTYGALGYLYIESGDPQQALSYNLEAVDYDDEDPVLLDNLGQTYYRLLHDRDRAKDCFDKAYELRPGQIDTLFFLSRYDLEQGKLKAALEKLRTAAEGRFSPLNHVTRDRVMEEIRQLTVECANEKPSAITGVP